ncbi:hypothetical protein CPB84DRAFT_441914 [Gymnopilus junonius]|uniref:Uncharacterized protein n=1 Tax=Gymnopilus junonius TaxID=109634 RepID=A0A9P5TGR7_GYMJU|nr:hypothetical protein CPB84DRAFT_441914 [Gymnopilus junonius]
MTRGTSAYQLSGQSSHVLLAACGSSELAHESHGHGNFSFALLKLLESTSPEKLTYSSVLTRMDAIPGQNPHFEGQNLNRILFNGHLKGILYWMLVLYTASLSVQNSPYWKTSNRKILS